MSGYTGGLCRVAEFSGDGAPPSHKATEGRQGIPVIAVRENHNCMKNDLADLPFEKGKFFIAENYLEAVGIMTALKEGVTLSSVRRPLADTVVTCEQDESQVEKEVESTG